VQKNQQMLSSFFFSACEVLKAGSSVKLIPPHANCEVIVFVHADSRSASLQAPPIRLYGHMDYMFAAQSCVVQNGLIKPPAQHDHVWVHTCHAVIDV